MSVAFSHITEDIVPNLFPGTRKDYSSRNEHLEPRIALMGSHIGASLATMLALTHPNDIHSVAIANPMVDWVILDELLRSSQTQRPEGSSRTRRSSSNTPVEVSEAVASVAKRLVDVRTKLFASPSAYFDPFASPTLFLRAPGRDTPRTHAEALGMLDDEMGLRDRTAAEDDWEAIGGRDEYWDGVSEKPSRTTSVPPTTELDTLTEALGTDSFGPYDDDHPSSTTAPPPSPETPNTSSSSPSIESSSGPKQTRRRKVLRRWPPLGPPENVVLPFFNIFVSPPSQSTPSSPPDGVQDVDEGMNTLFRMQGTELADLLRRACFYGREKGVGEERVLLTHFTGLEEGGNVDGSEKEGDEERIGMMVAWLRDRLKDP